MNQDLFCPMIQTGLHLSVRNNSLLAHHCCLRDDVFQVNDVKKLWTDTKFLPLRQINDSNKWDQGCWTCQGSERAGQRSLRLGTMDKFGKKKNLAGPQRIDLQFDTSCNLACRTCTPEASTFWAKHLKENGMKVSYTENFSESAEIIIDALRNLDLSNLELVVFCGGETLMGNNYWKVTQALVDLCPSASQKITLSFQTNGTQKIPEKYYSLLEKFHLIKLNISLDGIADRFEYLRWPAKWNEVVDNILQMKADLPVNTMFVIEETISIFNLFYQSQLDKWAKENFSQNRLGDIVNHTRHLAIGKFSIENLTQEYVNALKGTELENFVYPNWEENPLAIKLMLNEIKKFDRIRHQDWTKTFPEVASFYSRFANSGT